jgi:lipoprotein-anchoring transpeptidase ErfK/SrfK
MRRLRKGLPAAGLLVAVLAVLPACSFGPQSPDAAAPPASAAVTTTGASPGPAGAARTAHGFEARRAAVPERPLNRRPVNHCAHNRAGQRIIVSVAAQRMWLCAHRHTVRTNPVTTGMSGRSTRTPTGHYTIQGRNTDTVLTLSSGAQYPVKYWIPFDAPLFGFHDSSWQHFPYGSPKYRTQGSHGCVHMPLHAIAFLYRWVQIGAKVTIS